MSIYIAHSKTMTDSARVLAENMGVPRGALKQAPQGSVVLFLGVPTEEEAKMNKKAAILGSMKDIRAAFKNKRSLMSKLPNEDAAAGGAEVIAYVFGDLILTTVAQTTKTRKEFLIEKIGKETADELIAAGDIKTPEEEVTKASSVKISAVALDKIKRAAENLFSEHDLSIYALKAKTHNDSVMFTSMMFSPNLRRAASIIKKLSKTVSDIHGDMELVGNEEFVKSLSSVDRLKDIVTSASIKELGIISKFFDMVRKSCVENSDEING